MYVPGSMYETLTRDMVEKNVNIITDLDGSKIAIITKNVYKKGYHVTEACVLTTSN